LERCRSRLFGLARAPPCAVVLGRRLADVGIGGAAHVVLGILADAVVVAGRARVPVGGVIAVLSGWGLCTDRATTAACLARGRRRVRGDRTDFWRGSLWKTRNGPARTV